MVLEKVIIFVYLFVPLLCTMGPRSSVVAKALSYKLISRGFKAAWDVLILSFYLIFPAAVGPGACSASDRNEYQKQTNNVSGE
jgi:hypothetical protein